MNDEELLLKKRLIELSERSASRSIYTETDFLSLAGQSILHALENSGTVSQASLYGGAPAAERVFAVFGSETECGYRYEPEIAFLRVEPGNERFGEELSHRDVLGALMSLGVRRELTGDIYTLGKRAYIVVKASIAPYVEQNLISVKHTDVKCEAVGALPDAIGTHTREECFISTSERLDCILSAVYNISRSAAKELFDKERVYVNGSLRAGASAPGKEGDVVSVRGKGRFVYRGAVGETKKGRLKISVGIYE